MYQICNFPADKICNEYFAESILEKIDGTFITYNADLQYFLTKLDLFIYIITEYKIYNIGYIEF